MVLSSKSIIFIVILTFILTKASYCYVECPGGRNIYCDNGYKCCPLNNGFYNCCRDYLACCDNGNKCCNMYAFTNYISKKPTIIEKPIEELNFLNNS